MKTSKSDKNSRFSVIMKKLRAKIVERMEAGDSPTEISKRFGIACKTVYSAKNIYEATGDFKKRVKGGAQRKVRTKQLVQSTKKKIDRNPTRSIWRMATDASMFNTTMRRVIRDDLKMKSRAKEQCLTLTTQPAGRRESPVASQSWTRWNQIRTRQSFFLMKKLECWHASQLSKHPILGQKQVS